MERESESALVDRLRGGELEAFDEVFAAYHGRLFDFLARMSGNRAVAEDLLAETWLRLVSHAGDLAADTNLAAWLFSVARNLFVSHCRSRQRHEAYTGDLVMLWPGGMPRTPYQEAALGQMEDRLEAGIESLPLLYREALLLVAVEELRPAEAAVVCGVTPEAFRQRLSRARAALGRFLAGDRKGTERKAGSHG